MKKLLPSPSEDLGIFFCGPPAMNRTVREGLFDMGYNVESNIQF